MTTMRFVVAVFQTCVLTLNEEKTLEGGYLYLHMCMLQNHLQGHGPSFSTTKTADDHRHAHITMWQMSQT